MRSRMRIRIRINVKGRIQIRNKVKGLNKIKVKRCTNKNPNWKVHQGNGIFSTSADEIDYVHYKQCTKTVYGCFLFI
jgi:hypothetical protein